MQAPNDTLNTALWIVQILIALSFGWGGSVKLIAPIAELQQMWSWTGDLSVNLVRGLGVIDLAGGIGVLLPALTGIVPALTVWAALGCVLLQVCAIVFHMKRRETSVLPVNGVFLLLSGFILWGRWVLIPI